MMYGIRNIAGGSCYSPDRRNDTVDHYGYKSQFLGASGSRQGGYYYSASDLCGSSKTSGTSGWYDGAGRFHRG